MSLQESNTEKSANPMPAQTPGSEAVQPVQAKAVENEPDGTQQVPGAQADGANPNQSGPKHTGATEAAPVANIESANANAGIEPNQGPVGSLNAALGQPSGMSQIQMNYLR